MPTYTYECEPCGIRKDHWARMAERPAALPCPSCGGEARQIIVPNTMPVIVKGFASTEYRYDPRKAMGNNGAKLGRTPEQQHRNYERIFETQRQLVNERRAAGKEGDWEYLGGMPGEMHDAICDQEGDKNVVQMDPVPFLKANGLFMGKK